MNQAPPSVISLEGGEIGGGLISTVMIGKMPSKPERKGGSNTTISIRFYRFAQEAIIVTASTFLVHSRWPLELESTEPGTW
jgi:hypothetical protein